MLIKRLFDLAAGLIGSLLLAPLFLVVAALIKLESSGPVFFRQTRVGRHGVPFQIFKFRTMSVGAEARGQITVGHDARVTRIGRFLRKSKVDELPQLFNVVLGQMSLVGPRPEVPRYVNCYPAAARGLVLSVRPGITDWASIEYKDENQLLGESSDPERTYVDVILPEKLRYYTRYVNERSFSTDLRIIWTTLRAITK